MDQSLETLRYGQARLASESPYIPVSFPAIQLPGVDDILPFTKQESEAEVVRLRCSGGFRQNLLNQLPSRDLRRPELRLIESLTKPCR